MTFDPTDTAPPTNDADPPALAAGHLSRDEIASERCPDCLNDPTDETLHRDGCRRIFVKGDPREDLQFGPPWKPWRWR